MLPAVRLARLLSLAPRLRPRAPHTPSLFAPARTTTPPTTIARPTTTMAPPKSAPHEFRRLAAHYPWTATPLIVQAPMKQLSGPALAVAVSEAGGLGFIGPGAEPSALRAHLDEALRLASRSKRLAAHLAGEQVLPVGFGVQTWCGDLAATAAILREAARGAGAPCAAWLFAPRRGALELAAWTRGIRAASPRTRVWVQVASAIDAFALSHAGEDAPDVLVLQGADAGGHSRVRGAGVAALLPEVADALSSTYSRVPLVAAGGIADARGVAAVLSLGASGVAMGTRFLAAAEADVAPGYQQAVLDGHDGGQATVRTQLYNHLRGNTDWPAEYDARGLVNASWRDHEAGMSFDEIKALHDEAVARGDAAWGADEGRAATYAGTAVGLIKEVKPAGRIVKEVRDGVKAVLRQTLEDLDMDRV
jgi:nitronate monooxygenase